MDTSATPGRGVARSPASHVPAPAAAGIGMSLPIPPTPAAARAMTLAVRETFFRANPWVGVHCAGMTGVELARLFAIYDELCFRGFLTRRLDALGCGAPIFRFSGRLTSSAGRTQRIGWDIPTEDGGVARLTTYRIDVSLSLIHI